MSGQPTPPPRRGRTLRRLILPILLSVAAVGAGAWGWTMLANEERAATEAAAEARTEAERMEGEVESVRGRTARTERNARRVVAQMRRCLAIARIDLAVWERQLEAMRLGQAGSITRANELIEEFNADLDRANAMRRRCAR